MQYTGGKGFFGQQPTPTAKAASATLTIAELLTSIVTTSGTTAITLTLPTGTLTDAGVTAPALPVNGCFDWAVINTGTSSGAVTVREVSSQAGVLVDWVATDVNTVTLTFAVAPASNAYRVSVVG